MQSTTRGFTLIELILYFAIVGIVLFSILEFSLTALQNDEHYAALSNQRQTASRVLNTIDFLVRNADGLVEDTSGNDCFSTTTVLLYFATSSSDTMYSLSRRSSSARRGSGELVVGWAGVMSAPEECARRG